MTDFTALTSEAEAIRIETVENNNSANRVGAHLKKLVTAIGDLSTNGYLNLGIATVATVPLVYGVKDRVYYSIDCPASATTLTLTNFGGVVIPILTVPTRYSLRWGGTAWSGVVDKVSNVSQTVGSSTVNAPCENAVRTMLVESFNIDTNHDWKIGIGSSSTGWYPVSHSVTDGVLTTAASLKYFGYEGQHLKLTSALSAWRGYQMQMQASMLSAKYSAGDTIKMMFEVYIVGYTTGMPASMSFSIGATNIDALIIGSRVCGLGYTLISVQVVLTEAMLSGGILMQIPMYSGGNIANEIHYGRKYAGSIKSNSFRGDNNVIDINDYKSQSARITTLENGVDITTTEIIANPSDAGANYTGNSCIQDALNHYIPLATFNNRYVIRFKGIVKASQVSDFTKGDTGGTGQVHFIENTNPYISIQGYGYNESIIIAELPDNLGVSFNYARFNVVMWNSYSNIGDLSILGKNIRYCLHIDGGQLGGKDYRTIMKHLNMYNQGSFGDAVPWGMLHPFGLGLSDGQEMILEECTLRGYAHAVSMHTNLNFNKPCIYKLSGCNILKGPSGNAIINLQPLGSRNRDLFIVENCNIENGEISLSDSPWIPIALSDQVADHSEIDMIIDHLPLPISSFGLRAYGLKITSKSTGASSTVRFDQTSSAFNAIIGDSTKAISFLNKRSKNQIYDYEYKDGGIGSYGWAAGLKDIGEYAVGLLSNYYIQSLGKRLGDCSTVNKILKVTIDGTEYTITFDKNYNGTTNTVVPNFTNAQIIAEITDIVGGFATVDKYYVGREYFPQFKGVSEMVVNDANGVKSGMGVIFTDSNSFRKHITTDTYIDGVVLDDGNNGDSCRVITKGSIINANHTGQRFRTLETSTGQRNIGSKIGISLSQDGYFDFDGTAKVLKCVWTDALEII